MMVDFDAAVAAVQDPNADPVFWRKSRTRIRNSVRMSLPIRERTRV
ncbi:MAG: hypothetical protein ACLUB5_00945 [Bifidobacterium dentium]